MPRVPKVRGDTPVIVMDAITAFGSEVRVRLLQHWAASPGSQADAARALGVTSQTIADNVAVLLRLGVLSKSPGADKRSSRYAVNFVKRDELLAELRTFTNPPTSTTPNP